MSLSHVQISSHENTKIVHIWWLTIWAGYRWASSYRIVARALQIWDMVLLFFNCDWIARFIIHDHTISHRHTQRHTLICIHVHTLAHRVYHGSIISLRRFSITSSGPRCARPWEPQQTEQAERPRAAPVVALRHKYETIGAASTAVTVSFAKKGYVKDVIHILMYPFMGESPLGMIRIWI